MASVRRLTAILAADVAGYSRLMGTDEEGTHERLKAHLGELVNPKIAEHRGRIVKNTGDGILAEFPSVVDAVRCAAEVQRGMAERNAETREDKRITFRVGINLGDVIAEPDDIYGDGVNVAARLEALAEPGGICISRVVRDQIRDKLPYPFEDRGEQSVKNIARSVRVYALRPEAIAELPEANVPATAPRRRRTSLWTASAMAAAAVLVLAGVTWWVASATRPSTTEPATVAAATTSMAHPPTAPRLSIVVLPFGNLSNDSDQQYLADGITEDLTTDLSRIAHMFVISADTAFTYRGKPAAARQIGRELQVRYVLEGSVQRSGGRVRINAQLIDGETDAHLWAGRFEGDTSDLFALQDEITRRIAASLEAELIAVEARRQIEQPDALDYILKGRAIALKPPTRERTAEAIAMYERALAVEPASVEAQTLLALALLRRVFSGTSETRGADISRAKDLIEQASAASPRSWIAHYAKANLLRAMGRCAEAIPEYEAAIASNRNCPCNYADLGWCKLVAGAIDEVIPLEQQAIRLSPRDHIIGVWEYRIGIVHLLQSRTDEALVWFDKACSDNPGYANMHAWLASALALNGETQRAAAELAEARRLRGGGSYSSIARIKSADQNIVPAVRALFDATYFAGLRKAGMPEE
jgi:TolB-like protein/class 3 adenylate cyclase